MTAAEGSQKGGAVAPATQRERRQLQARNPALGAVLEHSHLIGGKGEPHRGVQERLRFLSGKTQVGGTHFGHLPTRTQPRERERRIRTRGDDEVHLLWEVL